MKRPKPQPRDYKPGHFLELVRRHDWPPQFEPRIQSERYSTGQTASEQATASLERGRAAGYAWGSGTIPGLGRRDARPVEWMQ